MRKLRWGWKQGAVLFLAVMLFIAAASWGGKDAQAAQMSKAALNKQVLTMTPATTKKLKLNGAASGVRWSSSNKKVAVVDQTGKITAKKKGKAKIKATSGKETYVCQLTVAYGSYKTSDGMKYQDVKGMFAYTGRWFKKSIGGGRYPFTSTDGSAFYFKVVGTKYVNISFVSNTSAGKPYFAYSVDGKAMNRQKINKGKINVGNTKTHYVRVVVDAMSEKENRWTGEAGVAVKSIQPVTKGGVISAVNPQNKTVAFYGDSITQGVRALNMALTPFGTSATHSYAWYCAEKLKYVPYFAGYGGSGIIQTGSFTNCINTIERFSAGRKAESFDADVIVVEHGTNDVYTHGTAFLNEYKRVVTTLHKKHPKAKILLMIPFTQIHADSIRKVAASHKKYCKVVETSSWKLSYTDGLHPNTSGAKKAGVNLAKKIKSAIK